MTLDINVLIRTVSAMFLLLMVGYAARKLGFIDDAFSQKLSDFVICVAQPFMLVSSIVNLPYSEENLRSGIFVIAIAVVTHAIAAALGFVSMLFMKDQNERRLSEFSVIFANCGLIGFPIIQSIFGDIGRFWASFYVIVFNVVCWTYGMFILSKAKKDIKMNFFKIFINYGTVPCLIGLIMYIFKLNLGNGAVNELFAYMTGMCTPLSMMVIGGLLATIPLKKLFTNIKVYYACLLKLIVLPMLVLLVSMLVGIDSITAVFATVMAGMPSAANTVIFAEQHELEPQYAAHIVGMSTLLSAFTIPLILKLSCLAVGL